MDTNNYYWNPTGGVNGTGSWEKNQGVSGGSRVNQRDSNGNEIFPSFTPGNSWSLNATATAQRMMVGAATTFRIQGANRTANPTYIRVAFGDVTVVASATQDELISALGENKAQSIPNGAEYISFIRETGESADVPFTLTLGG